MQVSVSPKYQVVIPKQIREAMGIKPGQKLEAINYNGVIQLVPVPKLSDSRGLLKGVSNTFERSDDRLL